MSGLLIALDKQPEMSMFGIGETWRRLFYKCIMKLAGPKSTNTCQDDQICAGLKAAIDRVVHGVQDIWEANSSTENCGFLLVNARMR